MIIILDEVNKLTKEAQEKQKEAERLENLYKFYPDLKKHVGRWDKIAYYSASVNSLVTDYNSRHNCGCCSDSPLEVWPYLKTEFGNVYSDPPSFMVGERDYDEPGGERAYPEWQDKLKAKNISEAVIEKISSLFEDSED